LCTYVQLHYAVRENDVKRVDKIWRSLFPLFKSTNKVKYAFLAIYVRFVVKHAHQSIKDIVKSRMISIRGFPNHHMGPDHFTEKVNLQGRYVKFPPPPLPACISHQTYRMGIKKATQPVIDGFFAKINIGMIANQQMKVYTHAHTRAHAKQPI
jgi:hypothetical protein